MSRFPTGRADDPPSVPLWLLYSWHSMALQHRHGAEIVYRGIRMWIRWGQRTAPRCLTLHSKY